MFDAKTPALAGANVCVLQMFAHAQFSRAVHQNNRPDEGAIAEADKKFHDGSK
jgi:hypothetical protein